MPKSILLADDSLTIQKVIELTFSDTDYELTTVSNGAEALAALERHRPDLVMADVVMPGKNGYEVCEAIKSTPSLADIPVILLSGTFEPFDRDRAERARANAIVTKPFDSKNLLVQVESLLHGRRPSPTTVAVPASPEASPVETRAFRTGEIGHPTPSDSGLDFAEFPAESAFEAEPAGRIEPGPLDAERPAAPSPEPLAFPMDDTSPFGRSAAAEPGAGVEETGAEAFSETDNVFEFPAVEPPSERETEAPSLEIPPSWSSRADQEITQELVASRLVPPPEFPSEPVFLHGDAEPEPEPSSAPESRSAAPVGETEAAPPEPSMPPVETAPAPAAPPDTEVLGPSEIAPDIERLAQGASISDLASMVSRIAAPVSLSDDDVERISRRVVERLSERIVRDIAWEVVPEIAEILVRQRLRELEAEPSGDSR
ncbi:MAG TPA: response regulator [Thermoanaerobaculia bacterium]|nr:response regulator [Thermoanaerobaculia bacterium]